MRLSANEKYNTFSLAVVPELDLRRCVYLDIGFRKTNLVEQVLSLQVLKRVKPCTRTGVSSVRLAV